MDIRNLIKLIWIFWRGGDPFHRPSLDLRMHRWKYNTWISIMIINTTCINVVKKLWSQLDGIAIYFEFLYNLLYCYFAYQIMLLCTILNWLIDDWRWWSSPKDTQHNRHGCFKCGGEKQHLPLWYSRRFGHLYHSVGRTSWRRASVRIYTLACVCD